MKFAFLIYQPHPFDPKAYTPDEHAAIGADYGAVSTTPGVTPAPPLGLPAKATTVRVVDGEAMTAEGPYAGMVHAVGGFMVVETTSLDEALALAVRIPAAQSRCAPARSIGRTPIGQAIWCTNQLASMTNKPRRLAEEQ